MVIKKKVQSSKIEIDLTGPQGNAFYLLGIARRFCSQLGKDWEAISKEMQSGDYENLLKVFDREFGSFVTLYR
jgi:hypothetical protein